MLQAQYKYALGTKVWVITDPQRATKKCDHCGEWTRWKPMYKAEEVVVGGISVFVSISGTGASYELHDDNGCMFYQGKNEDEIYTTQEEAEKRMMEMKAQWEVQHSS